MLRAAGFGPHDELGRTAADVLDQERALGRIEPVRAAEEGQPGLLLTGDDLRGAAAVPAHGLDERLAVLGVAHGARGAHADALGPERARTATERGEHLHGAGQSLRVQATGAVHVLAQPRDHHVARELGRRRARFDHEEPDRVRALVDRGHASRSLLGMDRLDLCGGPGPNGILATRQVVGVVRVQALHARARARHPAPAARRLEVGGAVGGVGAMGGLHGPIERLVRMDPVVHAGDRTVGLHPGDGLHRGGAGEPVRGRERIAVGVDRRVADHERVSAGASRHHRERGRGLAPQLLGHRHDVGRAQRSLGGGQRCLHEPMVAEATRTGR